MKKAIGAVILMVLLFIGAVWNVRHLDRMTADMIGEIELSRESFHTGDARSAADTLRSAIRAWNDADGYTHIFIRHAEVDAASDAFYEALSALEAGEAVDAAFDKLVAHLTSINSMEHVTWKSIF